VNRFKLFILFVLLLMIKQISSQNLQFYREEITFEIRDNYLYVDGIYNFCNNGKTEISTSLFYPFPIDSLYAEADSIISKTIISKSKTGFFFNVNIKPYGIEKYRIGYRQKLLGNKAEYILLTTQKWGIPLECGIYRLIVPKNLKITSFSYPPDKFEEKNNKITYLWKKKDFMPDKNMLFYFSR
jgi:hypothetical protein